MCGWHTWRAARGRGARAWRDINYEIFAACMKGINPAIKQLQRITNAKQFMRPGRQRELTSAHNVPSLSGTQWQYFHTAGVCDVIKMQQRGAFVCFFTARHLSLWFIRICSGSAWFETWTHKAHRQRLRWCHAARIYTSRRNKFARGANCARLKWCEIYDYFCIYEIMLYIHIKVWRLMKVM